MRTLIGLIVSITLTLAVGIGCSELAQAGRGAADGATAAGDDALHDQFPGAKLPPPPSPLRLPTDGAIYVVAYLAAKILGDSIHRWRLGKMKS